MTDTQLLVGSLSNDLFRVASLAQRGSTDAAQRFMKEARRWATPLQSHAVPGYISNIAKKVSTQDGEITMEKAERYLMYGVLLQNYCLHNG
jgi:hypothetical protein